jgi:hypothetical protein
MQPQSSSLSAAQAESAAAVAWVGESPSVVRRFNGNPRFEGWYGRRSGHRTGHPGRLQRVQKAEPQAGITQTALSI